MTRYWYTVPVEDRPVPADMRTPELVLEFTDHKMASARGEDRGIEEHVRLGSVVEELRDRGVLDR